MAGTFATRHNLSRVVEVFGCARGVVAKMRRHEAHFLVETEKPRLSQTIPHRDRSTYRSTLRRVAQEPYTTTWNERTPGLEWTSYRDDDLVV
jgi:hypothetical protein